MREFLYLLGIYCLTGFAIFLPWAIRAWSYTGNPIFPLANGFFKSPYFTPAMDLASRAAYLLEGVGTSWKQLAILPWTVTFHPQPFRGTLGILFLFGAILALLRSKTSTVRYAFLLIAGFFYQWGITAQEIRYILPLVPLLAVLTAVGLLGANPRTSPAPFGNPRIAVAGGYLGIGVILLNSFMSLPGIYPLWTREWTYWHSYQSPLPYLLGRQSAVDFLRRDVPSFGAYEFINRNLSGADRILLLNDANQFYSAIPTLYSFTVEGEQILLQESEEGVLRSLKESHITHVLLNYNGVAPLKGVEPRKGVYFFLDGEFQKRHLEAVYSGNKVVVYRLNYRL